MSRSSKKGPYVDPKLLKKVMAQKASGDKTPIKTWSRACTISPDFVGHTFMVHQGKSFIEVEKYDYYCNSNKQQTDTTQGASRC